MRNPKLIGKLHAQLPSPARRLLETLLDIAERHNLPLFLVGGPLRDLLLGRSSLDLDIAVEADAIALAREVADASRRDAPEARLGAGGGATGLRLKTHPSFLTATVRIEGFQLDFITARSETYARSGALPTVEPATIREDLVRRDFTINALALRLNGPERGDVLDPAGGLADLDARLIRALHNRSFQDDATRIVRAFRYAIRLGFAIEPNTLDWLKRDLRYLDTISNARIHHEFARILAEETPEDALRALHDHGAFAAIHPALRFERPHATAFPRLRDLNPHGARAAYWPVLAWRLTEREAAALARRLALTKPQLTALQAMPALEALEPALTQSGSRRDAPKARLGAVEDATTRRRPGFLRRSTLVDMLAPFPLPALWAFAALSTDHIVRDRLLDYLTKARHESPHLTGNDLLAMGVTPGPQLGDILRRLRNAKLDAEVTSREDEERLARQLIAEGDKVNRPHRKPTPSRSS